MRPSDVRCGRHSQTGRSVAALRMRRLVVSSGRTTVSVLGYLSWWTRSSPPSGEPTRQAETSLRTVDAMGFVLRDRASFDRAMARAAALVDAAEYTTAIRLAEQSTSTEPLKWGLGQLRAWVFTEAGLRIRDRSTVRRGVEAWRSLGPIERSAIAYNVANAELALFEIAVDETDRPTALLQHRSHLHEARRLYEQVAADIRADPLTRVQALTNCGNAFDMCGRDLEALDWYDRAVVLDPKFGMALGNRAITLAAYAGSLHAHGPTMRQLAAADLDSALADEDRVLAIGGPGALQNFRRWRVRLTGVEGVAPVGAEPEEWGDLHLRWCFERALLLHASHTCLRPGDRHLDPLFPRGFSSGLDDAARARVEDLVDALNVLKQDYVATRYLSWLASSTDSSAYSEVKNASSRVPFHDSLLMARWGVRTGLLLQALTAATNLLDKVAAFLHLYFETGRNRRDVYFRGFWAAKRQRRRPPAIEAAFARELAVGNAGLLALYDLACDMEEDTPLGRLHGLRHAATHRFLVPHHALAPPSSEWIERLEFYELVDLVYAQLRVARAAYVYLVRAVDIREARIASEDERVGSFRADLPLSVVDPEDAEID
jgi:tetratricopeptide (TPR) repeat protein